MYLVSKRVGERTEERAVPVVRARAHGRVLEVVRGLLVGVTGRAARRELQVLETLSIGNRKQLTLVSCGGERFLVGSGADGVGTIVKVRPDIGAARAPQGGLGWR